MIVIIIVIIIFRTLWKFSHTSRSVSAAAAGSGRAKTSMNWFSTHCAAAGFQFCARDSTIKYYIILLLLLPLRVTFGVYNMASVGNQPAKSDDVVLRCSTTFDKKIYMTRIENAYYNNMRYQCVLFGVFDIWFQLYRGHLARRERAQQMRAGRWRKKLSRRRLLVRRIRLTGEKKEP